MAAGCANLYQTPIVEADWLRMLAVKTKNRKSWSNHPNIEEWLVRSRLKGFFVGRRVSDQSPINLRSRLGSILRLECCAHLPGQVSAVAGLSVPYIPSGPVPFIEMAKTMHKDRFFYQLYFQQRGTARSGKLQFS